MLDIGEDFSPGDLAVGPPSSPGGDFNRLEIGPALPLSPGASKAPCPPLHPVPCSRKDQSCLSVPPPEPGGTMPASGRAETLHEPFSFYYIFKKKKKTKRKTNTEVRNTTQERQLS